MTKVNADLRNVKPDECFSSYVSDANLSYDTIHVTEKKSRKNIKFVDKQTFIRYNYVN